MSLIYYIPGIKAVRTPVGDRSASIDDAGLSYAFPGGRCTHVPIVNGPDGGAGCVLTVGDSHGCGHYPDRQTWQQAPGAEWWIGIEGETLPADLLREEVIDGHLVRLGDGQEWLVPVARAFGRGTVLPESLVLGPGGELVTEALPEFAEISADAERVAAVVYSSGEDGDSLTVEDVWRIAVQALALNYRVSAVEVSALKLLRTNNESAVVQALVDLPSFLAAAKDAEGNAPASPSTDDGGSD